MIYAVEQSDELNELISWVFHYNFSLYDFVIFLSIAMGNTPKSKDIHLNKEKQQILKIQKLETIGQTVKLFQH